jgi:hypothetical protein
MPRFGKNVLSQYLRTKCDKQLRLSIYAPPELTAMGWPVPLTARPAVQILRDAGIEWEQAKMGDLETAFGGHVRCDKQNGKYRELPLQPVLQQNLNNRLAIVERAGGSRPLAGRSATAPRPSPSDKARTRVLAVLVHPRDAKELVIPEPASKEK